MAKGHLYYTNEGDVLTTITLDQEEKDYLKFTIRYTLEGYAHVGHKVELANNILLALEGE